MTRRTRREPGRRDKPAAAEPCYECPFRTSNEEKQLSYEVDGINEFARIWWTISRQGATFGCHMAERECAGNVNMIAVELDKLKACGTWEKYHHANPLGLSRDVVAPFLAKVKRRTSGGIPVADPNRIILMILEHLAESDRK